MQRVFGIMDCFPHKNKRLLVFKNGPKVYFLQKLVEMNAVPFCFLQLFYRGTANISHLIMRFLKMPNLSCLACQPSAANQLIVSQV